MTEPASRPSAATRRWGARCSRGRGGDEDLGVAVHLTCGVACRELNSFHFLFFETIFLKRSFHFSDINSEFVTPLVQSIHPQQIPAAHAGWELVLINSKHKGTLTASSYAAEYSKGVHFNFMLQLWKQVVIRFFTLLGHGQYSLPDSVIR